jgi:transcriptional regulator with XRE-family HTH domain
MTSSRNTPTRLNPKIVPAIARRMRLLRRSTGLPISAFVRKAGLSRTGWHNIETGFSRIGIDAAMKLCEHLHATLDWIYRGSEALMPDDLKKQLQELDAEGPSVEDMAEVSPDGEEGDLAVPGEAPTQEDDPGEFLTIVEAKRRLAHSFGVDPSSIKIIIEA